MESTDVERLGGWLADGVAGSTPPVTVERVPEGRSNVTYRVTDSAGHTWFLRRPPKGALPGSGAHDVGREHRIIVAVASTAASVPVPAPVAFCDDTSVIGAPFSLTEHVDGHVLRAPADAEAALEEATRRRAGESFTDTLVALHAVDVDAAGLSDLGLGGGGGGDVVSQLRRWYGEARAAQELTGRGVLLIEDVYRHLCANVPPDAGTSPLSLVHGDYRLDNVIVDAAGNVAAVLDWETASLGDPLVELGLLLAYWTNPGEQNVALGGVAPTAAAGFPTKTEVAIRYADGSGRDLAHLPFYVAFAYWKLACILEGVYARQMAQSSAAGGDQRAALAPFADQVVRLAEAAREAAA